MTTGSFARAPLAELTDDDLTRMLELHESLFVEHKSDMGQSSSYQVAKAVSAFANTLGGWLLMGVRDGKPVGGDFASRDAPPLVDMVRDRLRGEVDPLPAFEARTMEPAGGGAPVGVVRVYESSDTPHVLVQSGSVFVREVAGDTDVATEGKPGTTKRDKQRYAAAQIRSRAQLIELAQRGERAAARARALMDYRGRPATFVEDWIGLEFELAGEQLWQPKGRQDAGSVFVRVAPYTGASRFQGWATTAEAAAAAIDAVEALSGMKGLGNDHAKPDVNGVGVAPPAAQGAGIDHRDSGGAQLWIESRIALESAGVVGAALHVQSAELRPRMGTFTLADRVVIPALTAPLHVLEKGGFLGRALCAVDFVGLTRAIGLEQAGAQASTHVSAECELTLPMDADELRRVARTTTSALGRSAGLRTWDEPAGPH